MAKVIDFPADRISKGIHTYYPELRERKPNCQMEARLSHGGTHYFVYTPEILKGRGIQHLEVCTVENGWDPKSRYLGWNRYKVTIKAFEKLEQQYSISMERLLD